MRMVRKKTKWILILTLSLTSFLWNDASAAGPKTIKKFPIPDHGVLELNVPASWAMEVHQPQKGMSPTMIFKPPKGNDFQVLITVLWNKTGEQDFNSPDKIKTFVETDGQRVLRKAVEAKLVVQQIRRVNNIGYYYSLTDKTPKPGEYRCTTRGGIGVGDLLLNFTMLHRVKDSEAVKETLSVLREAKQTPK